MHPVLFSFLAILAVLAVARAFALPSTTVALVPIRLAAFGTAADNTAAAQWKATFPGKIHAIDLGADRIYGTTPHTDVDATVKKGTTDMLSARAAIVDGSALVAGGIHGALTATVADLTFAADDVFKLDLDITGGSSPLTDSWAVLWVERFPS